MRVLLTNYNLQGRSGTELYIVELALSLLKRGHLPVVYTPRLGKLGLELREHTVPVIDNLRKLTEKPDIIHGHHSLPTVEALLRFPRVPALFVCHDRLSWTDDPPPFQRIVRWIAVDHNCRDRLVAEGGIPPEKVQVILNAVDESKFKARGPLPERPKKALIFSNQAGHVSAIESACSKIGLSVERLHHLQERGQSPETVLGDFDVVFAKGRCALEALSVGCSVVVCDAFGMGPLVGMHNFEQVRALNCGRRLLQNEINGENLARELSRYSPADSAEICRIMRESGTLSGLVDQWLGLYQDILDNFDPDKFRLEDEMAEAADFLVRLNPWIPELSFKYLWQRGRALSKWWLKRKLSRD
ncbi:MAG: glycosyltransferase [Candidatus Eremiobacteraeota bacterium]|nr:glycosyltransferase [Candidatus Eremiobacteraeota bacterium]